MTNFDGQSDGEMIFLFGLFVRFGEQNGEENTLGGILKGFHITSGEVPHYWLLALTNLDKAPVH